MTNHQASGPTLRGLLKDLASPNLLHLRGGARVKLRDASDSGVNWFAYHNPRIIDIVSQKTALYQKHLETNESRTVRNRQILQDMFVLAHINPCKPLSVLELGGACGATYFEQSRLQPLRIRNWHVVETPPMAALGRREFADGSLAFFSDLNEAFAGLIDRDLLMAKGVLQCLPDPLATLNDLMRFGFDYLYVARTEVGIGLDRPVILERTVNLSLHGPGPAPPGFQDEPTRVPAMILPFEAMLERIGPPYRIAYLFDEDSSNYVRSGRRTLVTRMIGFLAERRASGTWA